MKRAVFLILFFVGFFLLLLLLSSCKIIEGIDQFKYGQKSVPAYPAEIAKEGCTWYEGGIIYGIDENGAPIIGVY